MITLPKTAARKRLYKPRPQLITGTVVRLTQGGSYQLDARAGARVALIRLQKGDLGVVNSELMGTKDVPAVCVNFADATDVLVPVIFLRIQPPKGPEKAPAAVKKEDHTTIELREGSKVSVRVPTAPCSVLKTRARSPGAWPLSDISRGYIDARQEDLLVQPGEILQVEYVYTSPNTKGYVCVSDTYSRPFDLPITSLDPLPSMAPVPVKQEPEQPEVASKPENTKDEPRFGFKEHDVVVFKQPISMAVLRAIQHTQAEGGMKIMLPEDIQRKFKKKRFTIIAFAGNNGELVVLESGKSKYIFDVACAEIELAPPKSATHIKPAKKPKPVKKAKKAKNKSNEALSTFSASTLLENESNRLIAMQKRLDTTTRSPAREDLLSGMSVSFSLAAAFLHSLDAPERIKRYVEIED